MKSAEGNGGQMSSQGRVENLKEMTSNILKTIIMLEKPFGQNYLCQILRGELKGDPRMASHTSIETFGALSTSRNDNICCVFHLMIEKGLLESTPPAFNTLKITENGKQWLEAPQDWFVPTWKTKFRQHELYLRAQLRLHRNALAKEFGMEPWVIFNDFSLDALVRLKPFDFNSLAAVPGMNTYKCEHFGSSIIAEIKDALERFEDIKRASLLQKVQRGSYPAVKELFMEGNEPEEIAKKLNLRAETVGDYLRDLHEANAIDLMPWIEKSIPSKKLFKGSEYFRNVKNPSLKEALETLGLDYETLKFCRLYVSDFKRQEEVLSIPA